MCSSHTLLSTFQDVMHSLNHLIQISVLELRVARDIGVLTIQNIQWIHPYAIMTMLVISKLYQSIQEMFTKVSSLIECRLKLSIDKDHFIIWSSLFQIYNNYITSHPLTRVHPRSLAWTSIPTISILLNNSFPNSSIISYSLDLLHSCLWITAPSHLALFEHATIDNWLA